MENANSQISRSLCSCALPGKAAKHCPTATRLPLSSVQSIRCTICFRKSSRSLCLNTFLALSRSRAGWKWSPRNRPRDAPTYGNRYTRTQRFSFAVSLSLSFVRVCLSCLLSLPESHSPRLLYCRLSRLWSGTAALPPSLLPLLLLLLAEAASTTQHRQLLGQRRYRVERETRMF